MRLENNLFEMLSAHRKLDHGAVPVLPSELLGPQHIDGGGLARRPHLHGLQAHRRGLLRPGAEVQALLQVGRGHFLGMCKEPMVETMCQSTAS